MAKQDWKWYGFPGHFICAASCRYHLCTKVGGYLVSTVGDYWPVGSKRRETVGSGPKSFFETFVFHCKGETKDGDPNVSNHLEIESERYEKSIDAENGHYLLCEKYDKLTDKKRGKKNGPSSAKDA